MGGKMLLCDLLVHIEAAILLFEQEVPVFLHYSFVINHCPWRLR